MSYSGGMFKLTDLVTAPVRSGAAAAASVVMSLWRPGFPLSRAPLCMRPSWPAIPESPAASSGWGVIPSSRTLHEIAVWFWPRPVGDALRLLTRLPIPPMTLSAFASSTHTCMPTWMTTISGHREEGWIRAAVHQRRLSRFPAVGASRRRWSTSCRRRIRSAFHFLTTFTMKGFEGPTWTADSIRHIDEEVANGAVGVKVWKNVGMVEKDSRHKLIFLDDPRFDGLMNHLEQKGIPLVAHQAEPKNCWLPLDQMTTENDRSYFSEHPEYYMYLHPEQPSYEDADGTSRPLRGEASEADFHWRAHGEPGMERRPAGEVL